MFKLTLWITFLVIGFSAVSQETTKRKMQDDFEQFKKNRELDFQGFKQKREAELKKMQQEYQDYYNEMSGLKKYYVQKKDTVKAKVVDDIISYETNISQALGQPIKVTEEIKYGTTAENQIYKITPRYKQEQKTYEKKDEVTPSVNQPVQNETPKVEETSTSTVTPSLIPLPKSKAIITSPFGMRNHPTLGRPVKHNGIDFGSGRGTEIYAASNGKIVLAEFNSSFGNYIVIEHKDGQSTAYAHLDRLSVSKGDVVSKGQIIGYSGSTGRSTGPHLHYEVRTNGVPVNPKDYLIENK